MQTPQIKTESQSEKPRRATSKEQAQQLKALAEETGLANEVRNELFVEWLNSEPDKWAEIKAKLSLLSTAELLLNRMVQRDG